MIVRLHLQGLMAGKQAYPMISGFKVLMDATQKVLA